MHSFYLFFPTSRFLIHLKQHQQSNSNQYQSTKSKTDSPTRILPQRAGRVRDQPDATETEVRSPPDVSQRPFWDRFSPPPPARPSRRSSGGKRWCSAEEYASVAPLQPPVAPCWWGRFSLRAVLYGDGYQLYGRGYLSPLGRRVLASVAWWGEAFLYHLSRGLGKVAIYCKYVQSEYPFLPKQHFIITLKFM